jgi:hypothetical protein
VDYTAWKLNKPGYAINSNGAKMIEAIINKHLAEKQSVDRISSGKFHVSDAGRCHLMRYWKRENTLPKEEFESRVLRIFEVGHIFHKWIQDVLKEQGVLKACELRVEDENRAGMIDAIVESDGKLILYDFKTVHSRKFMWIKKEADLHYHYQAATYASMVNKPSACLLFDDKGNSFDGFKIDETRICYVSKDDLLFKEVPVFIQLDELANDWTPLIAAWDTKIPPIPAPMVWECGYCSYSAHCEYGKEVIAKKEAKKK